jgi:hypothetical protein
VCQNDEYKHVFVHETMWLHHKIIHTNEYVSAWVNVFSFFFLPNKEWHCYDAVDDREEEEKGKIYAECWPSCSFLTSVRT